MREVHGHEGSTLNNSTVIQSDDRDANGGAHQYTITVIQPDGEQFTDVIHFQKGPLKEAGLNGCSDEALLAIVIDRLEGFQTGPFASPHNAWAITSIKNALAELKTRTRLRQERGVEGTHQV